MSFFLQTFLPSSNLSQFVKSYYVLKITGRDNNFFFNPPQGTFDLVFILSESRGLWLKPGDQKAFISEEVVLICQQEKALSFNLPNNYYCIGVVLYPHTLRKLFKIPVIEGAEKILDLTDFGYTEYLEVANKLKEISNIKLSIQYIDSFIYHQLSKADMTKNYIDDMLIYIEKNNGILQIKDLAEYSNMSERNFRRKVKSLLGISPKSYNSIIRFNYVTSVLQANPHLSWQDLTLIGGYYDQNHLIKEFKKYTGKVPSLFEESNEFQKAWLTNKVALEKD